MPTHGVKSQSADAFAGAATLTIRARQLEMNSFRNISNLVFLPSAAMAALQRAD
jgi:hypothetical protein